ncbi:unnamed protein product [Eruca vesicaria subsp. sativa]|uniref:GRF-type domain-containing protein n=1 Tax=Eruca vesicaria subsp. sativa TaxID=29727 RepID=A0ABC8LK49_ERUVS|nr:unnamed protein product [Eruca vesicaria subsp. sativa]
MWFGYLPQRPAMDNPATYVKGKPFIEQVVGILTTTPGYGYSHKGYLSTGTPIPDDQLLSSSRSGSRRHVYSVPLKCWCGQGLNTWVSETKENPYRRFYRCKIALQNKSEVHLLKWIDEAILHEVRIVDAKSLELLHDFQALSKDFNVQLQYQRSWLFSRDEEMIQQIKENLLQMSTMLNEETKKMKEDIAANHNSHNNSIFTTNGPITKFSVAIAVLGAMSSIYWKLL